jgi:hypothetical protein
MGAVFGLYNVEGNEMMHGRVETGWRVLGRGIVYSARRMG